MLNIKIPLGSIVSSPDGEIKAEDLFYGDRVYCWDEEIGLVHGEVLESSVSLEKCFTLDGYWDSSFIIPENQMVKTNCGYRYPKDIGLGDSIFLSSSSFLSNIKDKMIVGYFFGDGWLSGGFCGGKRKIKRCNVSFSMHPNSDDTWIYEYINSKSKNKILNNERFIQSVLVPNGGVSKKIIVTDRIFWEFLQSQKCPVGKKCGKVEIELSDLEKKEFLTGIFSAEGCIYFGKTISIQIGMNWKECIEYISSILEYFKVHHTKHVTGKTYKLYISNVDDILKSIFLFDFRLDSRKQAKYMKLLSSILFSKTIYSKKLDHISKLKSLKNNGEKISVLKNMKPFNSRMFRDDYNPKFSVKLVSSELSNLGFYVMVKNIKVLENYKVFNMNVSGGEGILCNGLIFSYPS